jgi:hypothetical protein
VIGETTRHRRRKQLTNTRSVGQTPILVCQKISQSSGQRLPLSLSNRCPGAVCGKPGHAELTPFGQENSDLSCGQRVQAEHVAVAERAHPSVSVLDRGVAPKPPREADRDKTKKHGVIKHLDREVIADSWDRLVDVRQCHFS